MRIIYLKYSFGINGAAELPQNDPIAQMIQKRIPALKTRCPFLAYTKRAMDAPIVPTILLVPIASGPGAITQDKNGKEISPPPPTTESISPVINPKKHRRNVCIRIA